MDHNGTKGLLTINKIKYGIHRDGMETNELYLMTAFSCMACNGITSEKLELVKQYANSSTFFGGLDIESKLNKYVGEFNDQGQCFLAGYINTIANTRLSEEEKLNLARIAIKMIEAGNKIEYSEISFFKRIRNKLKITDEKLLDIFKDETLFEKFPEVEPEDFLLPDIIGDEIEWNVCIKHSTYTRLD